MTLKPKWDAKAIKAYESGQGVKLVNIPHPHYEPLPEDLNPESLETVEIEMPDPPQRAWVGLTDEEIKQMGLSNYIKVVRETEAKLKEKNNV